MSRRDAGIEQAMRAMRSATVLGVKIGARTWARVPPHAWTGKPIAHERPLVIVGGYGSHSGFYDLIKRSYEAAGIRRVQVMPPIDYAFGDIRISAERLASVVRLLGGEVDLIGHSEGGLVARWYVKKLGGADAIRHVVTLGTPNRGLPTRAEDYPWIAKSPTARRLHKVAEDVAQRMVVPVTSVALLQMFRGSEFMLELGDVVPDGDTRYLAIRSKWDGVVPFSIADLPPGDNVANVALRAGPRFGNHAAIASTSAEAFRSTMQFIRRR